jgi:hypothetical protein
VRHGAATGRNRSAWWGCGGSGVEGKKEGKNKRGGEEPRARGATVGDSGMG